MTEVVQDAGERIDLMVELKSVARSYGNVVALRSVDLQVRKGEFLTLLGPSGSGKSTLLNLIAGTIQPSAGRIFIDGTDATLIPTSKRGIGMVFQNYALMPHMTIFENIAFPLEVRRIAKREIKERVHAALDLVRLGHVADRRPRELSGGQQQRIALARCIVYSPKLILMDEPLGALDKKLREQMQLEIKRLHSELGITMIYVTHDQDEALTMSDRIVLMNGGAIEQAGRPSDLYFQPVSQFAAEFIGSSNIIPGTVSRSGEDRVVVTGIGSFPIPPSAGDATGDVSLLIRPENVALSDYAEQSIAATVVDSILLGGVVRHFVECADGSTLIVQELNQPDKPPARAGDRVFVTWKPAHARLLPKQSS